jgi:carbon-monoxide dehydrogenase small subunit
VYVAGHGASKPRERAFVPAIPVVLPQTFGTPGQVQRRPPTLLVKSLRETPGLTGTHVGCDTGQCGACVVHLDGRAIKSDHDGGAEIIRIGGLAKGIWAAFHEHHPLQCGFRTPGTITTAVDLLEGCQS